MDRPRRDTAHPEAAQHRWDRSPPLPPSTARLDHRSRLSRFGTQYLLHAQHQPDSPVEFHHRTPADRMSHPTLNGTRHSQGIDRPDKRAPTVLHRPQPHRRPLLQACKGYLRMPSHSPGMVVRRFRNIAPRDRTSLRSRSDKSNRPAQQHHRGTARQEHPNMSRQDRRRPPIHFDKASPHRLRHLRDN